VRICLKLKRSEARRHQRERTVAVEEAERTVSPPQWDLALATVHAEVAALPEYYRIPFVLCCLEGRGVGEVAEHLGWKLGTLSGRLTRAKALVLERVQSRGFAPAVAGLTVAVAAAEAPAQLIDAAPSLLQGTIRPAVESLANVGVAASHLRKIAAVGMIALGLGIGWYASATPDPPLNAVQKEPQPAEAPLAEDAWEYLFVRLQPSDNAEAFRRIIEEQSMQDWDYAGTVPGNDRELIFKRPIQLQP
jgi:hypothetical protein